jgi:hypothetical protein
MRFSEIWWVVPPMIIQTLAARYIYPKDLGDIFTPKIWVIDSRVMWRASLPAWHCCP